MGSLMTKWVGSQLVYYDAGATERWLDAVGPDVVKFLDDFTNTPFAGADSPAAYTTTLVEVGDNQTTVALEAGAASGVLLITCDENDNDGVNIQAQGEAFLLASGKECYFGAKIKIDEATESDFLVGLTITTTDALGGVTDGVYFRKIDTSTTMNFVLEKGSAETATAYGTAIAADTWYTLEFYFDGTNVDWYVNGALQTQPVTTNLPNTEWLSPIVHMLNGVEGGSLVGRVDWIRAIQINA
jgi:hypothetical protein